MNTEYLIVGLGNPGKKYDGTRHNIGFAAVDQLARKYGLEFKKSVKLQSSIAQGNVANEPCLILKPLTYMNLSGRAVNAAMRYHNIDLAQLLVLVDDVAIPMGRTKLKINSGPGGHNGLKSIEEVLGTNRYARLKLGIGSLNLEDGSSLDWDKMQEDLTSHVLGKFSSEEKKIVPALLGRAVEVTELFIEKGLTRAMDFSNRKNE
jgi:peptidyl-tRNA hydrolase, PTH1 family